MWPSTCPLRNFPAASALPSGPCCVQVCLSERNVVELVNKLKQLGLLGDDLLYTTNGKEYITRERVVAEVRAAVRAAAGRIPLVSWRGGSRADPAPVHLLLLLEAAARLPHSPFALLSSLLSPGGPSRSAGSGPSAL